MRIVLGVVFSCTLVLAVGAQEFPAPAAWKWVTDGPAKLVSTLNPPTDSWFFGTMAPGWHVTTRPGVLLFEPSHTARGRFALEAEIFVFPGTSDSGFGLMVGGRDLEGPNVSYVAFLMRRDGSVAVERRSGERTTTLRTWSRAEVIKLPTGKDPGQDPARNLLRVDAEAATAQFLINGTKVAEVPRDAEAFDGVVGFRIGSELNLHITNLDLTHRLALPRP